MTEQLKMHNKISLTNLYFNRFLAIRYSNAFFLFLNLYWLVFLFGSFSFMAILPLTLFILGILTAFEQIKLYRKHNNYLPYARLFYYSLSTISIILIMVIYTPLYRYFFPFLKYDQHVSNVLMILLSICLMIALLMLRKLNKIQRNEDKHFKRIQAYQKITN